MLRERGIKARPAASGATALRVAGAHPPDLVLLDVSMPDMDGYEVCRRLKGNPRLREIPVIFISALHEADDKVAAFRAGGVDYITKPFRFEEVSARVQAHLELVAARLHLQDQKQLLERQVEERTRELYNTQSIAIHSLAVLAEYRDNETGGHIMRTQHYMRALARRLATHPRFAGELDDGAIDLLFKSAPLHDIGKVGVPDRILLKPGALTSQERAEMQRHTIYGRDAIVNAEARLGEGASLSFLGLAKEITATHHERWDGSGYPAGLQGEAIPLSGRLMAIVDVYDALISRRVYKPPFPHSRAVEIITTGDGRVMPEHFDPDVLAAFFELREDFRDIALRYADHDEERAALRR